MGELAFADSADRQVPADGVSTTTLRATLTDGAGEAVAHRQIDLRPVNGVRASATISRTATGSDGSAEFELTASEAGSATVGLYVVGGATPPLATIDVDFTRKVVILAPGFQSALVRRFEIFGTPSDCVDPAQPGSITEALICLGYVPNAADDPGIGVPTPGATILDMSWEQSACRPTDPPTDGGCVAMIRPAPDETDALWHPPQYDLADLAISLARQSSVDAWAARLLRTMVFYDGELHRTAGVHASFYLVGHSLGGEVVVRTLRALLNDPSLAGAFEGENRGRLQTVLSVDGALNWTGGFDFFDDGDRCGFPVHTTPDQEREVDNVDAVERAFDRFGSLTVATTSETDPIVGPDVALLNTPDRPDRGYVEALVPSDQECTHSSLLRPEPVTPVSFPLNELLVDHVGPATGR